MNRGKMDVGKSQGLPRWLLLILMLFAAVQAFPADTNTFNPHGNYHCIVCGKGPLHGRIWITPHGPMCDDCAKLTDRCSICGLPVRDGDGHIKTADGRFICRFDKDDTVLTLEQAHAIFDRTRDAVVNLYGQRFALKYNQVAVRVFDIDHGLEKQGESAMHEFGFSNTRISSDGECTHEVVLLSGRLREEVEATAAHEYTHLWINENRPDDHVIDPDTIEAICELTAYKLMQKENLPDMQKRILENPYTHGRIKVLVAIERERGTDYVLRWVKESKATTFDDRNLPSLPASNPRAPGPALKFTSTMQIGRPQAVINGIAFTEGEEKTLRLQNKSVSVHCDEINADKVIVTVDGHVLTLNKGEEKALP